MHPRFYAPGAHAAGDTVPLPAEEATHLTRVLRLKAGDAIRVFNGRGSEFDAVVDHAAKEDASVRLLAARDPAAEASLAITLAQAVLKGDKMDDVIRDAVMLGVAAIQPMVTTRSEVPFAALDRGRRRERWQRVAVSSAKQCGRAVVPPILEPCAFDDVPMAIARLALPAPALMFVEPGASAETLPFGQVEMPPPLAATLVIGPEGGWTPEEIAAASASCHLVSLGARTLRADATPLIAMAALFTRWGEY